MAIRRAKLSLLLPLLAAALVVPLRARADCGRDTDCKEDRICQRGICVDRSVAPDYTPPPPLDYPPPPPRRGEVVWAYPMHATRSFGAIGGVGDFLAPTFGGVNIQATKLFRFFDTGAFEGGLTLNIYDDFALWAPGNTRFPFYASVAGGVGFDFGFFKMLQFGPRVNLGYGSDVTNNIYLHGGFVSFGGHVIVWLNSSIGLYLEADTMLPMSEFSPAGSRLAGGIAFSWD